MTGVVTELWRYPVKSMLGERREFLHVNTRGVLGDRLYAVRDRDGKLGSGKNTRRFRRIDGLFGCRASYDGAVPVVAFPGGVEVRGDDPSLDTRLRQVLGQDDLRLAREGEFSHFDSAPLHVVTEASLSWLAGAVTDTKVDSRRARPNLVVATGAAPGPVENTWVGQRAEIGGSGGVVVEFTELTERCVMVNNAQSDLTHSSEVLRTIATLNDLALGIYATVIRGGTIRLGDEVRLTRSLRELPASVRYVRRQAAGRGRALPVAGVQCAATGIGAHDRSPNNVEDFPLVEDRPP